MIIESELSLADEGRDVFCIRCEHCTRPGPEASTAGDAVVSALREGWRLKLGFVDTDGREFFGLDDLVRVFDTSPLFCPSCYKREFET